MKKSLINKRWIDLLDMKKMYQEYINEKPNFDRTTMLGIIGLMVVIAGMFGWLYEYIFYFFNGGMKQFYWRGGNFLPWINIYAYGALGIYFLTFRYRKKPLKVFILGLLICGLLEFLSGYVMYNFFDGWRCWDYNKEIWNFGNIGGFVCLRSVTFFGLSGLLLIYGVMPCLFWLAKSLNKKVFLTISITLLIIILFDDIYNLVLARLLNTPRASNIYKRLGFHFVKF